MEMTASLVEEIDRHFVEEQGIILIFGSLSLANHLRTKATRVAVIDYPRAPDVLAQHRDGQTILRAQPLQLPTADRSISGIVAVNILSRVSSPNLLMDSWSRSLRPGGKIVLVEREMQGFALRTWQRLIDPSRFPLAPEHLTCLLLNAGFAGIGQAWPSSRLQTVVTSGWLKAL